MFGDNVRILAAKRKMPLNVLAQKAEVPYNTLMTYLKNRHSLPNVETGYRLAKALGVSVEYLVTGKPSDIDTETVIDAVSQLKCLFSSVGKSLGIVTDFIANSSSTISED